jgi:hypothetical protein
VPGVGASTLRLERIGATAGPVDVAANEAADVLSLPLATVACEDLAGNHEATEAPPLVRGDLPRARGRIR